MEIKNHFGNIFYSKNMANCLRVLSVDLVEKAKSGHPGAPLGMADLGVVLWKNFLKHDPAHPNWINRDRFVLSNGHASALLYSLLHLTGYKLSIEDLKQFRQIGSNTPGHPERDAIGVETTTGPLGQGFANAVGMALAEKILAKKYNTDRLQPIDHTTYCFAGDGDLMEGISHEAASLAGTLSLGKLIVLYDDNRISIDGDVTHWMKDDTAARFTAYGWDVVGKIDGHNPEKISEALAKAKATDKPSLIICNTKIGYGAPKKQGSAGVHGSPLGADENAALRKNLGWNYLPFEIPNEIYKEWSALESGSLHYKKWQTLWEEYQVKHPDLYQELNNRINNTTSKEYQNCIDEEINAIHTDRPTKATRASSQRVIERIAPSLPGLFGGSADLTGSNLTNWSGSKAIHKDMGGNYLHYGVREFAMVAMQNGMAIHGGFIPYGGTFLVFSDYCRNAVRLSAMMKLNTIFVFTHDSIGLGEDGPTHQPVEHLWSLRLIPNLTVWRPADGLETLAAWHFAIKEQKPTVLALSRQKTEYCHDADKTASKTFTDILKGGYYIRQNPEAQAVLIATGTELSSAVKIHDKLLSTGIQTSVVSMPSVEIFSQQDQAFKDTLLPRKIKKVVIEAGTTLPWKAIVGSASLVCGLDSFGASGPGEEVYKKFGMDVESLYNKIRSYLE